MAALAMTFATAVAAQAAAYADKPGSTGVANAAPARAAETSASGAFNFVYVPFNDPAVLAGNLAVRQNGTGNAARDVTVSVAGGSPDLHVIAAETNRGDYAVRLGDSFADDVASGALIGSIRNNGRDHGQGQGVQYGSVGVEVSARGNFYLALSAFPSGDEYNADVALAHFPYSRFTAGYARNAVNNGPLTQLQSSPDVALGSNLTTLASGVYSLKLAGVNALSDGVLVTVGGRNDDNISVSRPYDDGSGFLIGVRDNGNDGARFEPDGFAFVFLRKGDNHLVFGRAMSDGSIGVSNGNFELRKTDVGTYRLTIPGADPTRGTLLVSSEGFDLRNQDNFVSYEADGNGWTIQTRDMTSTLLQDAGEKVFPTSLTTLPPLPQVDRSRTPSFEAMLHSFRDATVPYTLVAAHRAGYFENGATRWPENSLAAIAHAIELGVDMVELDIWKTADGQYVLMHDETVDRTTNGSGRVADLTLAQIKALNLVVEDTREVTAEKVPTLAEALQATRGRILVNFDVKLPITDFAAILNQARGLGVEDQVVIKSAVDTPQQIEQVRATLAALPFAVEFMPIMRDNAVRDIGFVRTVFEAFRPNALEVIVRPGPDDIVSDGGFMFSEPMRALAAEYDVRLWINTLYSGPYTHGGDLNGLRNDYLALVSDPVAVFGFWANQGAGMIQTDESQLAIATLQAVGARPKVVLGGDRNGALHGTAGADVLVSTSSHNGVMKGGGGADVFKFGPEFSNGVQESRQISDYQPGVDMIDLGGASVVQYRENGNTVVLYVGDDLDVIRVVGARSIRDVRIR